jgi:hypothetical protein
MTTQNLFYPDGITNQMRIVAGQHTTASASDDIVIPALRQIVGATVTLIDDPTADPFTATCAYSGNTLTIKTWQTPSSLSAAATFSKRVDFVVMGY